MNWVRQKFTTVVVVGIATLLAAVFVFEGVFTRGAGNRGGAFAGSVNGEPITMGEFKRELDRRMEFFKSLGGGTLNEEQLKAFRIREGVFNELVNRKLMSQAARSEGMVASDDELRQKIREIQAFQKDGRFDAQLYRQVLQANNYGAAQFEQMMREDISLQKWGQFFKDRVKVSDEEIQDEFLISGDRRDIKYVMITPEAVRKTLQVSAEEVKKYLADEKNVNLVKSRYEAGKDEQYKGRTLEQARGEIAQELLTADRTEEVRKLTQSLAEKVAGSLQAGKGSDAALAATLKPYGLEGKSTGQVNRKAQFLPGLGEARELVKDAFAPRSPIDGTSGGKAKIYLLPAGTVVALVTGAEKPDLSKLDASRDQIRSQLASQKERELFEAWMKKLSEKADIERNKDVIDG